MESQIKILMQHRVFWEKFVCLNTQVHPSLMAGPAENYGIEILPLQS